MGSNARDLAALINEATEEMLFFVKPRHHFLFQETRQIEKTLLTLQI